MKKKKGKKKMWIILGCVAGFLLLQWLFIGYRFSFGPFKALGDIRMAKLPGNAESYGMDRLDAMEGSPLEGKKILFLGSSVTYGAASLREGIPEYFAVRLDAEVTKEAVSGTTLTDDSDSSYVHRLLTKIDPATPYSLVVVQLSTNDASKNKPLGEISNSRNKEDFNTRTVTGAIEYIIAYSRETWGRLHSPRTTHIPTSPAAFSRARATARRCETRTARGGIRRPCASPSTTISSAAWVSGPRALIKTASFSATSATATGRFLWRAIPGATPPGCC